MAATHHDLTYRTHCPMCRYNLRGLPDAHQCPECGERYYRRVGIPLGNTLPLPDRSPMPPWLRLAGRAASALLFMISLLSLVLWLRGPSGQSADLHGAAYFLLSMHCLGLATMAGLASQLTRSFKDEAHRGMILLLLMVGVCMSLFLGAIAAVLFIGTGAA